MDPQLLLSVESSRTDGETGRKKMVWQPPMEGVKIWKNDIGVVMHVPEYNMVAAAFIMVQRALEPCCNRSEATDAGGDRKTWRFCAIPLADSSYIYDTSETRMVCPMRIEPCFG